MTKFSSLATATALLTALSIGSALAQTATPAPKTDAAKTEATAPKEKKAEKPRSAASLECSKEADTKSLHGKERKKFMSECKKTAAEKAK